MNFLRGKSKYGKNFASGRLAPVTRHPFPLPQLLSFVREEKIKTSVFQQLLLLREYRVLVDDAQGVSFYNGLKFVSFGKPAKLHSPGRGEGGRSRKRNKKRDNLQ